MEYVSLQHLWFLDVDVWQRHRADASDTLEVHEQRMVCEIVKLITAYDLVKSTTANSHSKYVYFGIILSGRSFRSC